MWKTSTDYIVLGLLLFAIYRGMKSGFLRSILGPITLLIGSYASMLHYKVNHNMMFALAIALLAPFVLYIIAIVMLKIWQKATKKEQQVSQISQLFGIIFNVIWTGTLIVISLLLILAIPRQIPFVQIFQKNIEESKIYSFIDKFVEKRLPAKSTDIQKLTESLNDPVKRDKIAKTAAYKNLINNETFKEFISDDKVKEQIQKKDFAGLLSNPKLSSILQNPDLLKELLELNKEVIKINEKKESKDTSPEPTTIEVHLPTQN